MSSKSNSTLMPTSPSIHITQKLKRKASSKGKQSGMPGSAPVKQTLNPWSTSSLLDCKEEDIPFPLLKEH